MSRLLLFFFVLFGVFMAMRACSKPEPLPDAVPTEGVSIPAPGSLLRMESKESGIAAGLSPEGTLVSLVASGKETLRAVPETRRPFSMLLHLDDGALLALDPGRWTNHPLKEGPGFEFDWHDQTYTIAKKISLSKDGAIHVAISVKGPPDKLAGIEMTCGSAVPLDRSENASSGALWIVPGQAPSFRSFLELAQGQTGRRAVAQGSKGQSHPTAFPLDIPLDPPVAPKRFGVLGEGYFGLAGGTPISALHVMAYYARSGSDVSDQIEAWASVAASKGDCTGGFDFRYEDRTALRKAVPAVFKRPEFQKAHTYTLENKTLRYVLTDRGAAVLQAHLKHFSTDAETEGNPPEKDWVPILRAGVRPGERALTLTAPQDWLPRYGADPGRDLWQVTHSSPTSITFRLATPKGWVFEKKITLPPEGRYDLAVDVTVRRPDNLRENVARFAVVGPAGPYIADAYRGITGGVGGVGLILERSGGKNQETKLDDLAEKPLVRNYAGEGRQGTCRAVAGRGAFFVCALRTQEKQDSQGRFLGDVTSASVLALDLAKPVKRPDKTTSSKSLKGEVSFLLTLKNPEGTEHLLFYGGPNDRSRLSQYSLSDTVDYGIFGFIGRGLVALMDFFAGLVGSYGVAIILMTFLVRVLLLPVSYRTQIGMQRYSRRLQKLKPLLDQLEKKFGKNKQKLNTERMKLMREHKVGLPLGCLTMFIQIPIWIALFRVLRVEFSLRHQAFLWAHDLTMPDRLLQLGFWPHWLNLLPILMLVLWLWQQQTAPTAGSDDPQVKMQMKMMKAMPILFFFFLYNYAAALSVYMCVSSTWGIVESKLVRRALAKMDA